MRTSPALAVVLLLLLAACGPEEQTAVEPPPTPVTAATPSPTAPGTPSPAPQTPPAATPEPTPAPTPTPEPTPEAEPTATAQDETAPVGPFERGQVEGGDFPSLAGDTAHLTDVRVAAHDGFDRVVLEFEGTEPPSYRVGELDPPVREDGSGEEVTVDGAAFLELRMTPASGVDLGGVELTPTYEGPERVAGAGTGVVTEVVRTGDFEANLAWVVGLERAAPFAARWLQEPLRLVVDVAVP